MKILTSLFAFLFFSYPLYCRVAAATIECFLPQLSSENCESLKMNVLLQFEELWESRFSKNEYLVVKSKIHILLSSAQSTSLTGSGIIYIDFNASPDQVSQTLKESLEFASISSYLEFFQLNPFSVPLECSLSAELCLAWIKYFKKTPGYNPRLFETSKWDNMLIHQGPSGEFDRTYYIDYSMSPELTMLNLFSSIRRDHEDSFFSLSHKFFDESGIKVTCKSDFKLCLSFLQNMIKQLKTTRRKSLMTDMQSCKIKIVLFDFDRVQNLRFPIEGVRESKRVLNSQLIFNLVGFVGNEQDVWSILDELEVQVYTYRKEIHKIFGRRPKSQKLAEQKERIMACLSIQSI